MRRQRGFTLLETLVALAILAIALSAAFRGIGMASGEAGELNDRLLAEWVGQDVLAERRIFEHWAEPSVNEGTATVGPRQFRYREEIKATPNSLVRRVEVSVYPEASQQRLAFVIGFLARAAP